MSKQTILITGATSGIGRDAAVYLAKRGHRVFGTGRNEEALEALRAQGVTPVRMDVNDAASIAEAKAEVERLTEGYGIDALVNNAGYGLFAPMELVEDADLRAQFETNVFGLHAVTQAFVPAMRVRGKGRIINVSSVGGRMVFPFGGAYHATKYAVEAMSDALRMELLPFGVHVSIIEPGYIKTNFTKTTLGHLDKYRTSTSPYAHAMHIVDGVEERLDGVGAEPVVISKAITKAIESRRPRARYVAPWINSFGPIIRSLLPTRLMDWVFRRVFGLGTKPPSLPAPRRELTA